MKIENKQIYLDFENDYQWVALITHIAKTKYGELRLRVKDCKPYQIIETQKSILLTQDSLKDSQNYGE